jgi:uncharacterized protein (TIGR00255 family)
MTGFSSKTVVFPTKRGAEVSLEVEIKSLNSRFFESTCKLPSSLSFLEIPIINLLKEKLVRGRVFVVLKVSGEGGAFEKVSPVIKIVDDYIKSINAIKKRSKISGQLTISDVVSLPNVFSFEKEVIGRAVEKNIIKIIEKVTDDLIKTRKAEGMRLKKDLDQRFSEAGRFIEKIGKLFDSFMKKKKAEIKKMIMLSQKGDQEAERHLGECYDSIDKIDVHEEIVRFKSHLGVAKKLLASKEVEKGKRFEFTLQELGREINTIAAKCSNFDMSSAAVDVKVELEKVREQVQNIV